MNKTTTKNEVATVNNTKVVKTNATTKNASVTDLIANTKNISDFISVMTNNEVAYNFTIKNNLRELLNSCGYSANGKSANSVPNDCYLRFNNGTQVQFFYDKKTNKFKCFNVRVCDKLIDVEHNIYETVQRDAITKVLKSISFDKCNNDCSRTFKSNYIDFSQLEKVLNTLVAL